MNKIKYLLIALIVVFIYSCEKDYFDDPPAPSTYNNVVPEIVDSIDNTTATLLKLNESVAWDTLAWKPAQLYEGQGLVTHYSIQVTDLGGDFSTYMEFENSTTSDTFIIITEGNLNTELLANGYGPVQTYDLQLRIKSFVHNDLDSVFTESLPFTVTTYMDVPISETMYIYGSATTVDWDASEALLMYSDNGVHTGFTYLENNMKFRFLKAQDTLDNTYNSGSLITYSSNVSAAGDNMKNFVFTGTSGWYKIEANYLTSMLTIEEYVFGAETYTYDYDNLYIVGDYDPSVSAWDANNAVAFTKESEGIFTIQATLKDGAAFKFIGQQSWGDLDWGNLGGDGNTGTIGPKGYNGNIQYDGGEKLFEITVNLKQGTYVIEEIKTELYMIGDGVGDWDWGNTDLPMIPVHSHQNLFWKIVWMNASGGFKFAPEKAWGQDFGSDTEVVSEEYNIGTKNVPVPGTAGYYMVVVDLDANKISVTEPDVYLIGNTVGSWDTANPDAKFTVDNTNQVLTLTKDLVADEIRMYAWHSYFTDWWQSEFIILSGNIEFRGTGPDQTRVSVTAGSNTVELDFINGTGSITVN